MLKAPFKKSSTLLRNTTILADIISESYDEHDAVNLYSNSNIAECVILKFIRNKNTVQNISQIQHLDETTTTVKIM